MSEEDSIAATMGFSGFGRQKSARKFDIEEMFKESLQTAQEYSAQVKAKQQQQQEDDEIEEEAEIGPPVPPTLSSVVNEDEEEDNDDEDDVMEDEPFDKKFPLSCQVNLDHGSKPVSALGLDPAGARLITGCYGYEVRFWDFAGMDTNLQSFRSLTPCECHPICCVQYNHTGELILVASGNAQAVVLDRNGQTVLECPKGWQYIADMTNTNGHISMINNACWHPFLREQFITCSNDCTIRVWDINEEKKQLHVIKSRTKQGKKSPITTCTYSKDGKYIAGAQLDGSILLWKTVGGSFVRPNIANYAAHVPNHETSCLNFAHDNNTLISRGGDGTLKLWDVRQFRSCVHSVSDLFNHYSVTDCVFNPDEQIIITGTSAMKNDPTGNGQLLFFDRQLNKIHQLSFPNASVVRCLWHPKLNQIFVGCSNGDVKVYYSDKHSNRGVKMCMGKVKKNKVESMTSVGPRILTPHALPMFQDEESKSLKRKREKERKDPVLSHRPDLPVTGKGVGGRVSSGGGSSIGAYMRKLTALETSIDKDEDPREALLKYAKMAEENPMWVNPAYKKTQPVPIFREENEEDEEDQ